MEDFRLALRSANPELAEKGADMFSAVDKGGAGVTGSKGWRDRGRGMKQGEECHELP